MSDPVPVEGVVLPERPKSVMAWTIGGHGQEQDAYRASEAEKHFSLLECMLAEVIAQRDAARELSAEYKSTYELNLATLQRNHDIERKDWQQDMRDLKSKAEAALATERDRANGFEIEAHEWEKYAHEAKAACEELASIVAAERARTLQEALNVVRYTPQDGSTEVNQAVSYIESGILALIQK